VITQKGKLVTHLSVEFGENHVDRNYVRIEAIDPGRKNQVKPEFAEVPVPPALYVVPGKKPKITRKVRGAKAWDAMPHDFREVNVLNSNTVEMDFICVC
jgi:hypothetical protein